GAERGQPERAPSTRGLRAAERVALRAQQWRQPAVAVRLAGHDGPSIRGQDDHVAKVSYGGPRGAHRCSSTTKGKPRRPTTSGERARAAAWAADLVPPQARSTASSGDRAKQRGRASGPRSRPDRRSDPR